MKSSKWPFRNRHVILPVIHVKSLEQALENALIAKEEGCDGVFLISHAAVNHFQLLAIHRLIHQKFPTWWIGVNLLGVDPEEVLKKVSNSVSGVWVDNAGIDEQCQQNQTKAEKIMNVRDECRWQGLYFGGVAFKYQREVQALAKAASIAKDYMDVVTTSGTATGQAPDISKIAVMKQALGDAPLAIASGITPGNVDNYLPIADCFLVATGISRTFFNFDAMLLKELVKKIRNGGK